jgi:probable blue pigment (indigoidine) exporter
MDILIGLLFAVFWASAAVATKIGLRSADPIALLVIRFLIAGALMLLYVRFIKKERLPVKEEWKRIGIFSLLNTAIYLSLFFIASKTISAGLATLFVSINPLLIAFIGAFYINRTPTKNEILGFIICFIGLLVASLPNFQHARADISGIIILLLGMLSYSFGTVYFKKQNIALTNLSINAWQVLIAGIVLIPVSVLFQTKSIIYNSDFYVSLFWLTIVISIFTMLLWLYLLKKDTVKASRWLYVSPIFGYILSYFVLHEPITWHAGVGTVLVIAGLIISR